VKHQSIYYNKFGLQKLILVFSNLAGLLEEDILQIRRQKQELEAKLMEEVKNIFSILEELSSLMITHFVQTLEKYLGLSLK